MDEVNALNVYPVPDGDTGTNLIHTMRSALAHAREAGPTAAGVAAAAAHGALMGARGNSGVILSQMLRGLDDVLRERDRSERDGLSGADTRAVFAAAKDRAYAAVTHPAAGTMLTALSDMAEAIEGQVDDATSALRTAVHAGVAAVERTREANPTNRAAGVVDAGARGLWLLLDGALAAAEGRASQADGGTASAVSPGPATPTGQGSRTTPVRDAQTESPDRPPSWKGAYDVQFLVKDPVRSAERLREEMVEFGADCVLVVGDDSVVKVHVHTLRPDQIIRIGMTAGRLGDVVVEDLDAMSADHERASRILVAGHGADPVGAEPARTRVGVVAVVPGDGFADIVRSLGGTALRGGATMNPSTEELVAAIREAGAEHVIVLPNDRNAIAAAQQAADFVGQQVTVIPTRSAPQGMSALVAFDPSRSAEDTITALRAAGDTAHTVEVTRAVRETTAGGEHVRVSEPIALLDGELVAHGGDEAAVAAQAVARVGSAALITLYVGAGVSPALTDLVRDALCDASPGAEVEVVDGGQPHYPFLIAVE